MKNIAASLSRPPIYHAPTLAFGIERDPSPNVAHLTISVGRNILFPRANEAP
jgi:hypothetical protein